LAAQYVFLKGIAVRHTPVNVCETFALCQFRGSQRIFSIREWGCGTSPWRTTQTHSFRPILDGEMLHAGEIGLIFPLISAKV
jgi:NADH:ubiquinone oxidoreductase subunit E